MNDAISKETTLTVGSDRHSRPAPISIFGCILARLRASYPAIPPAERARPGEEQSHR
jgi:hypothetical protein